MALLFQQYTLHLNGLYNCHPNQHLFLSNVVFQHDLSQEELQLNVDKLIDNVYKHTGSIDANNLDEVFHISNTDRSKVTTTDIPFGSVSVGDIILDTETLETNIVAPFGFTSVNVKEIA